MQDGAMESTRVDARLNHIKVTLPHDTTASADTLSKHASWMLRQLACGCGDTSTYIDSVRQRALAIDAAKGASKC